MQEQLEITKSQNEILKSKEDARVKAGFETIVKSSGFIGETLEESVVEFLCKSSDETAILFHDIIKSAQEKIASVEAEKEEIKKSFAPEVGFNAPAPEMNDVAKTEASVADFRDYIASLNK